ncbi:MAG: LysR family transcriptional regulator [Nannocystales bacterium]
MPTLAALDLNLLHAFAVMMEERSVTAAAKHLGVTQPAMSHKLRRLRDALGDELFVTAGKQWVPTERAAAMAQPLRQAMAGLADLIADEAPFDADVAEHEFVIAAADLFEFSALPGVLDFISNEAPGIRLAVASARQDTLVGMRQGKIHFAFGPGFDAAPGLRQTKLGEEPFVVIGRKRHPAFRGGLTLERYLDAEHMLIAPEGRPGGVVDNLLAKRGLARNVVYRGGYFATAPFLVARSDMLLTAPKSLATAAAEYLEISTRPVPFPIGMTSAVMAWHERFDREPAHRWFRETARRIFRF